MATGAYSEKKARKAKHAGGMNAALAKPVRPDAALAAVVGEDELPRPEVVKRIWDYIKAHQLQDPSNRRMINADDKLLPIFDGQPQVNMFDMTRLVSRHIR
jgi:upstream activation factor subunit UAF30